MLHRTFSCGGISIFLIRFRHHKHNSVKQEVSNKCGREKTLYLKSSLKRMLHTMCFSDPEISIHFPLSPTAWLGRSLFLDPLLLEPTFLFWWQLRTSCGLVLCLHGFFCLLPLLLYSSCESTAAAFPSSLSPPCLACCF